MVLLDTHVLSWMAVAPEKLSRVARDVIETERTLAVSALIAFEFDDLVRRGRLPGTPIIDDLVEPFGLKVLAFPTDCWRIASRLPAVHGDPVDRMLIAHAIRDDYAVITADQKFAAYPVRVIW